MSRFVTRKMFTAVVFLLWISKFSGNCDDQNIPTVCDYIIVGAGASGATLAGRLSELEDISVCLFEEGASTWDSPLPAMIETPRLWERLLRSSVTRNYTTVPQRGLNGRVLFTGMGKAVGGSTAHNAMNYFRGFEADYDYWASQGATGWSYADVYPYFLKYENNVSPFLENKGFHSKGGPLTISQNSNFVTSPLYKLFTDSAKESNIPLVDCTTPSPLGLCHIQVTVKDGKRQTAADAFLKPVMGRRNLCVVSEALVEKILIGHVTKRAYGIRFSSNGKVNFAKARREIIISAGAIDSPKLLQLSGIGPRSLLERFKIRLHADLPVGENYHDHYYFLSTLFVSLPTVTSEVFSDPQVLLDYILERTGIYAESESTFSLFTDLLKNQQPFNWPEIQSRFSDSLQYDDENKDQSSSTRNGTKVVNYLLHPKSRGTIQIRSLNPLDSPLIDPKCFQEDDDLQLLIAGMRAIRGFTSTTVMRTVNAELLPSEGIPEECNKLVPDSDQQWECVIRQQLILGLHPTGTCKMGDVNDRSTVVDTKLRVKGIKGLRVADASIMPEVTSTNTMGPCIMIGEKAADIIKEDYLIEQDL